MKIILPNPVFYFERWRYSKLYGMYVSNHGHLKDKNKKTIQPKVNQSGYLVVKLKYGNEFVHRIVAAVWLPTEDMYHLTVDHLDHNKRNNAAYNLEWVTKTENQKRAQQDFNNDTIKEAEDVTLIVTTIKMYADSNYTCLVRTFDCYMSAANYIKNLPNAKNDEQQTLEVILKNLNNIKIGQKYQGRYWKVEKGEK